MKKLPISAILVVYNEEAVIRRCLDSIFDYVNEIIIVHDGECTDRTVDIAHEFTDKVYVWKKKSNAEHHRSKLVSLTSNEWVFQIDADEFLSSELQKALPSLISMDFQAHEFDWPIWYMNKYYKYGHKRALYKKSFFYHIAVNHEYMKPISPNVKINTTELLLEHKPKANHFESGSLTKRLIPRSQNHAKRLLTPFSELEKWNCTLTDWEPRQKLRLAHPIILGVIGTFIYVIYINLIKLIKYKSTFYIRSGFILATWNASVYYYYYKYKKGIKE